MTDELTPQELARRALESSRRVDDWIRGGGRKPFGQPEPIVEPSANGLDDLYRRETDLERQAVASEVEIVALEREREELRKQYEKPRGATADGGVRQPVPAPQTFEQAMREQLDARRQGAEYVPGFKEPT